MNEKRTAIIVDLDGTLVDLNGRRPFGHAVEEIMNDLPRRHVIRGVERLRRMLNCEVILCSGRVEKYREVTERYLAIHFPDYVALHMRANGDNRNDAIVKREIYDTKIAPYFDVKLCVDDRPRVIRMYREEVGLRVIDVGAGIEF